jgi:iron-sulfur cluster assembly accessory protein|tara:strand:+ start:1872 stop:2177 length:306 start_codon:yes stop_codon:yes gene_type:complete
MKLTISDSAKQYLNKMIENENKRYVTLDVKGGGCSGFRYEWNFSDEVSGNLIDDILVIDVMAEMFLFGCTVDYVQELGGSYLTVVNPNATASCGCGESFAV